MHKKILAAALATSWGLAGLAVAHEGHEHKVMGKVVTIDDKHIEVEAQDGKKVSGVLGSKTTYMREKAMVSRADVKVGERVVVTFVQEKDANNVKEVLLGAKPAEGAKTEPHKH